MDKFDTQVTHLMARFVYRRLALNYLERLGQLWLTRCIQQVDATPSDVNLRWEGGVAMRSGRLGLSAIDKREIWSRWKAGETLHEIGRAYSKYHNTIRAVLVPCGGNFLARWEGSKGVLNFGVAGPSLER